jgi:hypothetical protein
MLGGGRDVHAESKQHMEELHCPSKRALSMSLGVKSKKLKPAKLEAQTTNSNTDVVEGRSYSRAGATNNYVNLAGMSNVSNTCYANAVVQALRFCPGFRDGLNHACNRSGDVHPSLSMSLSEVSGLNFVWFQPGFKYALQCIFDIVCSVAVSVHGRGRF